MSLSFGSPPPLSVKNAPGLVLENFNSLTVSRTRKVNTAAEAFEGKRASTTGRTWDVLTGCSGGSRRPKTSRN